MHSCDDMILMCIWEGEKVNCDEIFTIHKTDNGFCCSFNVLKESEQFMNVKEKTNSSFTEDDMEDFHDDYSDDQDNVDYFWASSESFHGCGGLLTEEEGWISSPSKADDVLQCEWIIRAPVNMRIHLMFTHFHLESDKGFKCSDYVSIYDGGSTNTELFPLLGRYCGFILPPDHFSTGNQLLIQYHAESSLDHEGFDIAYRIQENFTEAELNHVLDR